MPELPPISAEEVMATLKRILSESELGGRLPPGVAAEEGYGEKVEG